MRDCGCRISVKGLPPSTMYAPTHASPMEVSVDCEITSDMANNVKRGANQLLGRINELLKEKGCKQRMLEDLVISPNIRSIEKGRGGVAGAPVSNAHPIRSYNRAVMRNDPQGAAKGNNSV